MSKKVFCNFNFSTGNSDDKTSMLGFLRDFDPISKKYEFEDFKLTIAARAAASEFEAQQQFGNLTKQEFDYIADNLKLVYWDKDIIENDILTYYLVENKIVHQYLAIPQLDRLFDEDYFNFEWDMHVGQNFKEHRNDYYRDHFIHQIRDMYMMLILLDKFGFYEASSELLNDPGTGKISDYTSKKWKQFEINHTLPQRTTLKKVFDQMPSPAEFDKELELDYVKEYFFHYVVYSSAMLSALFHDVGYPICHFLEVRHRISDYNPFMYMFTHNAVDSFDQLASKLGSSLLFTIVSSHEIKSALQLGKNGQYNHGAYSAMAFLLQFYENGFIYSLSPEKQCAIELAAVAIYNHTAKYDILEYKEENNYCAPVFRQNPISFLLRFCDDLQEWDRRYFEISSASDFIFCPDCGAPMLKDWERKGTIDPCGKYICLCEGKERPRPDIFIKRKLFLVSVADSVDMDIEESKNAFKATINYDLYRLLLLSNINNTYAKYRSKELYGLKKLISYQDYSFQTAGKLAFRHIKLDYFMSANPLLIKLRILELYLRKIGISNIQSTAPNVLLNRLMTSLPKETDKIQKNLPFYLSLMRDCLKGQKSSGSGYSRKMNICKTDDPAYYDALNSLINDCFEQYKKAASIGDDPFRNKNSYVDYSKPYIDKKKEDNLYYAISLFTDQRSRCNQYSNPNRDDYIGYYTDMYLFYLMNEEIKNQSLMTLL